MAELKRRKIGLVIEGGGAKGAYAFGWLRAFAKHGIRFDAIAGTSAGALNALACATSKVNDKECRKLWRSISFKKTYPFRLPRIVFILAALLNNLTYRTRRSFDNAGTRDGCIWTPMWILGSWFVVIIIPTITIICCVTWEWWLCLGTLWYSARCSAAILALFAGVYVALVAPPWILDRMGATLLKSSPLRSTMHHILHDAAICCPTYITVAYEAYLFGRDAMPETFPGGTLTTLKARRHFIPQYLSCQELSLDDRVSAALASAALPYGLVPSVAVGGKHFVDGGVVDNVPVYPLITHEHCDIVVVVRVNPTPDRSREAVQERYQRQWRKIADIFSRQEVPTSQIRGDRFPVPVEPSPVWPEFIEFAPEAPLGGRWAFLAFFRKFTVPAEKRGWQDAKHVKPEVWQLLENRA